MFIEKNDNRERLEIKTLYEELIEEAKSLVENWEIKSWEVYGFVFYMGNLVCSILINDSTPRTNINLELLTRIAKIFKNNKSLILEFLLFIQNKYNSKICSCKKVLGEAIEDFEKNLWKKI